ncbi:MAG: ribosome-associated translation inhibitor RaiA [Minisyncoccales bacterium]
MKTKIKATNINLTPYLEDLIKEKMADIAKLLKGEKVLIAEIEVGLTSKHHQKGDIYRAEIQIEVPNKLLRAVSEKEDFRAALTDAKDEIGKQIIKYKDKKITDKRRIKVD